jgi:hypothetical protein
MGDGVDPVLSAGWRDFRLGAQGVRMPGNLQPTQQRWAKESVANRGTVCLGLGSRRWNSA